MSQRNPMNDRYTAEDKKGQTRKSAAKAKPKTKAASSVRIEVPNSQKTKQQKKAAARSSSKGGANAQDQRRLEYKYGNPTTPEFKKWKRIWWGALGGAIVMTALSFLLRWWMPDNDIISMVALGVAYVGIIGALIIDQVKVKKLRREFALEMEARKQKENRAAEKKARAAAKKAVEEAPAEEPKKTGLAAVAGFFGFNNLKGSAKKAAETSKQEAAEAPEAAKPAPAPGKKDKKGTKEPVAK